MPAAIISSKLLPQSRPLAAALLALPWRRPLAAALPALPWRGGLAAALTASLLLFLPACQPQFLPLDGQLGGELDEEGRLLAQDWPDPLQAALLLPLSAQDPHWRQAARDMALAAELALFDQRNAPLQLVIKDTGGEAGAARYVYREAVAEGVDLIIGPVLAPALAAAGVERQRGDPPVIALSANRAAGQGLFLLGFSPEEEIRRIILHAAREQQGPIAAFLPRTPYGALARQVLVEAAQSADLVLAAIETYDPVLAAAFAPARHIADFERRQRLWEGEKKRLQNLIAEAAEKQQQGQILLIEEEEALAEAEAQLEEDENIQAMGMPPYKAVFFAEGGDLLRGIVQLLPLFEVPPEEVRFLGTGLWDDGALTSESPLWGARFAAAHSGKARLAARLAQLHGGQTQRIASLAYDAVALAAAAAKAGGVSEDFLTRYEGFSGADGRFRFIPAGDGGGYAERLLSVREIRRSGIVDIAAPPEDFMPEDFLPEDFLP